MIHLFILLAGLYLAASVQILMAKLFPMAWLLDEIFVNPIFASLVLLCRIGIAYAVFMIFVLGGAMIWSFYDRMFSYAIAGANCDTKEVERRLEHRGKILIKIINILSLGLVNTLTNNTVMTRR